MTSPRPSSAPERAIIPRWMRALLVISSAAVASALSAAALVPAAGSALVEDVQLPTLADPTGPDFGVLMTAPMVALIVVILAGVALVIAALKRRSAD